MSSTARAKPSSVFDGVTCLAWCFTSELALPIAMLRRLPLNICTSLGHVASRWWRSGSRAGSIAGGEVLHDHAFVGIGVSHIQVVGL